MTTPPQTPSEEPRSPSSTTPGGGQAAFIYPIRSAVSVKPATPLPPSLGPSSQARRNHPTTATTDESRDQQHTSIKRNVFDLHDPPQVRPRSPSVSLKRNPDNMEAEDEIGSLNSEHNRQYAAEQSTSSSSTGGAADVMRKLRIGDENDPAGLMPKGRLTDYSKERKASISAASVTPSVTSMQTEQENLESMMLPRFKHVATEHGHMVVTGREGEIKRCEDEPIHVPGAVQSFGCMIVVREEEEGRLVVRQVSENTGDILGLSPSYLFKLDSILDCFEESQADVLWDNIESLEHSPREMTEIGPHVFQLSGRGQSKGDRPGRTWKCWVAAHRVTMKGKAKQDESDGEEQPARTMTVLEFELINDVVNPIAAKSPPGSPTEDVERGGESSSPSHQSSVGISPPPSITTIDSDGTTKISSAVTTVGRTQGGPDGMPYIPTPEQFMESTQPASKPLTALQRIKRAASGKRQRPRRRPIPQQVPFTNQGAEDGSDMLDMFGILSQVNEQFAAQSELQGFLKVVVSIMRELTGFSRVMVYQFDEKWNGQVVCELVDWNDTHDLYRGLHFPATDIPKQARDLYVINKIRLLYDRDQPSARMVCREKEDLDTPIDMTHSFLRAMSPIHVKYLANMGVRASMSISVMAFDQLWGLISLHTYGTHGRRISFPMRQLCRLIGESVSRNIERLSYTRRLSARKLINTLPTDQNPSGYIISNAEDLLTLFDADFGVIAIGNEAKILGPLSASQEVLAVTEYLRIKRFQQVITSQDVASDFPDMILPGGLEVIAGLLLVPLSSSGIDFITFLRKAQVRHVNWAGKPFKEGTEATAVLEPRKSFKIWSETVTGTCRSWKDEELETASVLCLVYGKFISVWRQREQAMQYNQLNKLLLSNATHEVRTPLNHIINYLEMALDSQLDADTRENLSKSHMASKSLLFVINDLLDLTRHEEGNKLLLQEPFDLSATVREAVEMHEWEAKRRKIEFTLEITPNKCFVIGDAARIRQIVINTVSNSVKYTEQGHIHVEMRKRSEEEFTTELPEGCDMEVELSVSDTGRGISREKLEAIFREFEQVESVIADPNARHEDESSADKDGSTMVETKHSRTASDDGGIGLGLAIVARVVRNLGGQLRVDSTVGGGSRFTYLLPFRSSSALQAAEKTGSEGRLGRSSSFESGGSNNSSVKSEIHSLVEAISAPHLSEGKHFTARRSFDHAAEMGPRGASAGPVMDKRSASNDGTMPVAGSAVPLRSIRVDPHELDSSHSLSQQTQRASAAINTRQVDAAATSHSHTLMSSKFAAGEGGRRDEPPSSLTIPEQPDAAPPTAALLTSSSGESGSSGAHPPGSSAAERRRARAKLISPGLSAAVAVKQDKLSPLRVLVVEDDPVNRMILKKRLSMDGHSILLAVNGEDGVQQFEKVGNSIDVILMDLQMPICNGQEACKRIRELERQRGRDDKLADRPAAHILNGRIPIFAVSATLDFSMRQEMCDIGMDGWVLKPIDFKRLRALLKGMTHLENREEERWKPGHKWEKGGWLSEPAHRPLEGGNNPP